MLAPDHTKRGYWAGTTLVGAATCPAVTAPLRKFSYRQSRSLLLSRTFDSAELLPTKLTEEDASCAKLNFRTRSASFGGNKKESFHFINAVISAIVNFMLMFSLCCAYGIVMFRDNHNHIHRVLAVKMNLITAGVVGLFTAVFSEISVAIAGPDLNPVVFYGAFIATISEHLGAPTSEDRRLGAVFSPACGAAAASNSIFNMPSGQEALGFLPSAAYHEELRATVIFTIAASTGILGLTFFCLGKFRLTRFVAFVPMSVTEAFLSCIGYKVFKYGLVLCDFDPKQFIPAATVGVLMYFMKVHNIGHPAITIPGMIVSPLVIFYVIAYATGNDIASMRRDGWMFEELEDIPFWHIWTDSVFKYDKINFKAWVKTIPDLIGMIVVISLDCVVKLSATQDKIPIRVNERYEMKVIGVGNFLAALCGSSVGYLQLKLNVLNYGILGKVGDRRAGYMYSLMCIGCLYSIRLFNYVPRLFIGSVLFFAASAFVAENLWGSRKFLSMSEWSIIVIILVVFVFTQKLLYVVVIGGMLTGICFLATYACVPPVAGLPLHGNEITSSERREPLIERNVRHICGFWLLVIRLKGFLFFASIQSISQAIQQRIDRDERENVPAFRRLKFLLLDVLLLDSMDASASKALKALVVDLARSNICVLWSSVSAQFLRALSQREIIDTSSDEGLECCFADLDSAILGVEELALTYRHRFQSLWIRAHPAFARLHDATVRQTAFHPFGDVFFSSASRLGCPLQFCHRVKVVGCKTVLWEPREHHRYIYLIHTAVIGLFSSIPEDHSRAAQWDTAQGIYGRGWLLNSRFVFGEPTSCAAVALEDGELLCWDIGLWLLMGRDSPQMLTELMKACMRQGADNAAYGVPPVRHIEPEQVGDAIRNFGCSLDRPEATFKTVDAIVPEPLMETLHNLEVARVLGEMDFYDVPEDSEMSALRPLPAPSRRNLMIAFATYQVGNVVPWCKVLEALHYAGIFGPMLTKDGPAVVDEVTFLAIGHESLMARLGQQQRCKLQELFDKYSNRQHRLERCQLQHLWHTHFLQELTTEQVDEVCDEWDVDGSGDLDIGEFEAIVSRLIKNHEADYAFLSAIKELVPDDDIGPQAKFRERLGTKLGLTTLEVDEMLWAADWLERDVQKAGLHFTLPKFVGALTMAINVPISPLPPEPVMPEDVVDNDDAITVQDLDESEVLGNSKELDESEVDYSPMSKAMSPRTLPSIPLPDRQARTAPEPKVPLCAQDSFHTHFEACCVTGTLKPELIASNKPAAVVVTMSRNLTPRSPRIPLDNEVALELGVDASPWVLDWRDATETQMEDAQRGLAAFVEAHYPARKMSIKSHRAFSSDNSRSRVEYHSLSFRAKVFYLLEDEDSSPAAKIVLMCSTVMIVIAILIMIAESFPWLSRRVDDWYWEKSELFFTVLFSVEYIIRLLVCNAIGGSHTIRRFVLAPANICEVLAVSPFYIEVALGSADRSARLFRMVRLMRISRLTRLSRLAKKYQLVGPVMLVVMIIWGIYMKERADDEA